VGAHPLRGSEEARRPQVDEHDPPPPSLTTYASYGEGSSPSHHRWHSLTLPASSSSEHDELEAARVIRPEDFINDNAEEACVTDEAIRESQEAAATVEQHEEAEWCTVLKAEWSSRRGRPPPTALRCRRSGSRPLGSSRTRALSSISRPPRP
jgi:hypothetical protein